MLPTLRKNGLYWVAAWRDSSNRRRFKNLGKVADLSKTEAKRLVDELGREHGRTPESVDVGRAPRIGDLFSRYLGARERELDQSTLDLHRGTIRRLEAHFGPDLRADRLTRIMASEWRGSLTEVSQATVRRHVATARQVFGWAQKMDLIRINPFDRESVGSAPRQTDWTYVPLDAVVHWRVIGWAFTRCQQSATGLGTIRPLPCATTTSRRPRLWRR